MYDFDHVNQSAAAIWRAQRATLSLACFAVGFLLASSVHAQTVLSRPTVTRAEDVFQGHPDRIPAGTRLVLKAKEAPAAKRIVNSGLQVRVFALRADQSKPTPITTIEDCDVFLSVVLKIEVSKDTEAMLPKMDHGWLGLSDSLERVEPGKYLLVFEQSGPTAEQFRLRKSDYAVYFNTGFQIVVDRDDGTTISEVRAAYFARRDKLNQLRFEIDDKDKKMPCFSYRQLTADATQEELQISRAELQQCEREAPTSFVM
ncbi:hypothetical protein [Variovorax sp. HJSM1_2]|uniref:hypothetical protein n=1 Tax=Variovorax sp. HJSM1_2 TaxID=3366263 RepID=UPI003BDA2ED4